MSFQYKRYFPFPEIRQEQTKAIDFALDAFINKDKRFVILEMGTGAGKSPVAIAVSKYMNSKTKVSDSYEKGTWFLTTQKILQDQYVKDFGGAKGDICSVKSSSNYQCHYFKKNKCSESLNLLKEADKSSKFYKSCTMGCGYRIAKRDFLTSKKSITNFPYFLTETMFVGGIKPRHFLVIDECHTIEDELSKFIEITVSEKFASAILEIEMPLDVEDQGKAFLWIRNTYTKALIGTISEIQEEIKELQEAGEASSDEAKRVSANLDRLNKHKSKIDKFLNLYDNENWIFNLIPTWNNSGRKLEFKPIDIGTYAEECLFKFGEKVLLLSATILNKEAYCESIGINLKDTAFVSIDSPFPVENTPVIYFPVGNMSIRGIDETLPKLVKAIKAILKDHPDEKGIIHTRTFKISKYIEENIKNSRILTHSSEDREEVIKKHMKSKKPTVLVSPSSTEGLDLKDDLSRFQIICKIHWPYLGDELVKSRMDKYTHWYAYQAVKSLIQARGRSIRTAEDYAVTYILDDGFESLYSRNIRMFPKYFRKSLHMDL